VKRLFETDYGYFWEDGSEYVIKTPRTPKPWINIISNGEYGLTFSQSGGGFSWLTHSEMNRITRWHQDLIQDNWGKYLYIRDDDSGEVWNPGWLPTKTQLDNYECHHGIGYSRIIAEYGGIQVTYTIFVPMEESLEIWNLRVKNLSDRPRNLSIISYLEWSLGASNDHHREFHKSFLETRYDESVNGLLANKRIWDIPRENRGHWNTAYDYTAFHAANRPLEAYEGDKEAFLGQYGDLNRPSSVWETETLSNTTGKWNDSIGSLQVSLELAPRETENLNLFLGVQSENSKIEETLKQYQTQEQTDKALEAVVEHWRDLLGKMSVKTPNESINILVNQWLRYQAIAGRLWARTGYYQQSGAYGFRDQLQDSQVFLPIQPERTAEQIKLHAQHQKTDGTVLHWWHPIVEQGMETKMTDDLLWLPFIVGAYLDETGDYEFLNAPVEYFDAPETKETIYQHCIRAIEVVLERISDRGLPLIGAGDWNDGLSAVGLEMKGESIWLGHFLYMILTRFAQIARRQGKNEHSDTYQTRAKELRGALEDHGWDGEWFLRATKDNGEPLGSHTNNQGRIYLNPQTWAVIAGSVDHDKQGKAMQAVTENLLKDYGPLLLYPAYQQPDEYIGYLSRYAPGTRENGGVYMHAATWSIWAYAKLGQPEMAFEVYNRICPILNGNNPDRYLGEPYVTPGNIDGPDSEKYGRGGWTWYTGSAAWLQKVLVDWILGIRATEEGLLIDPCIPADWDGFSVERRFRGTRYLIQVENPSGKSTGVSEITLDGKPVGTTTLPISDRDVCNVQVTM